METKVIYGVFAIDVEAPEKTNGKQEIIDVADSMKELNVNMQKAKGRFVRAYAKLSDAVSECYHANGWMLTKTLDCPDGVTNGKYHTYYFPRMIEIL